MKNWERTEFETTEWVQNNVPDNWIVKHFGGCNSKKPDLRITHKVSNEKFNLEIKLLPSRCGQFSLKKKENVWGFSGRNQIKESFMSKQIIQYINKEENMSDVEHKIPKTIIYHWVKDYLSQKKVEAIVASTNRDKHKYVIFSSLIENFLDINLVLRKKKSGSRVVPNKEKERAQKLIIKRFPEAIFKEKEKYLIVSNINPDNQYVDNYFLSPVENGYSVRKLSNSSSVTVEFLIFKRRHKNSKATRKAFEIHFHI